MTITNLNLSLEIKTKDMSYDKKTNVLAIELSDYTFIGHYKKSTKFGKIIDDLYISLKKSSLQRENIRIIDSNTQTLIPESLKLKDVFENGLKEDFKQFSEAKEIPAASEKMLEDKKAEMGKKEKKKAKINLIKEDLENKTSNAIPPAPSRASKPPGGIYKMEEDYPNEEDLLTPESSEGAGSLDMINEEDESEEIGRSRIRDVLSELSKEERKEVDEREKPITYEINMGFQYYSVMMEQKSYLFYVYFSHKKLLIVREDGKTIYETTVTITTTKKEPPILDLKIEGEGFDIHPLSGKVVVKKNAVNPPVMIFSISPLKNKERTVNEKREAERRFLNIYIEFEGKTINHTILSVIVQPKHFHLNLGPIQLDISKNAALLISILSIAITMISVIYSVFSFEPSSSSIDILSGASPSIVSFTFIISYALSIIKGLRPLKQKWSKFLNFDKVGSLNK